MKKEGGRRHHPRSSVVPGFAGRPAYPLETSACNAFGAKKVPYGLSHERHASIVITSWDLDWKGDHPLPLDRTPAFTSWMCPKLDISYFLHLWL